MSIDTLNEMFDELPEPKERVFAGVPASKLIKEDFHHRWLIDGLFEEESMTVLYGPSNVGKSLLALDWALHIATGHAWHERSVKYGRVAYIQAEGERRGFARRLRAWSRYNHVPVPDTLYCYLSAPQLDSPKDVSLLIDEIRTDCTPSLIVIDTLKSCSVASKESDNTDMSKVLDACAHIQKQLGCAILLVHHCSKASTYQGKEADTGPIGAYALVRRPDTVLSLRPTESDSIELECKKQRDAEKFGSVYVSIETVELGPLPDDTAPVIR